MKISIITVTYNSEKTIKDTLASIANQTFKNIEHIIIDGKSTDNTINIIKKSNHNVVLISEPDNGIYDAMNKGIKIASGDIIGILNSDDLYFDNNIINMVVNEFIIDNELNILYGDLVYVKQYNTSKIVRNWITCDFYNNYFENGNVPPHPSLFLRNKVYEVAGLFNSQFNFASDYEFMLRIFKKHSFKKKYINHFFVKMRLGGATNKSIKNIYLGNIEILKSWFINDLKIPLLLFPKRFFKKLSQFL